MPPQNILFTMIANPALDSYLKCTVVSMVLYYRSREPDCKLLLVCLAVYELPITINHSDL